MPIFNRFPNITDKRPWLVRNLGPVGIGINLIRPGMTMQINNVEKGSPAEATGKLQNGMPNRSGARSFSFSPPARRKTSRWCASGCPASRPLAGIIGRRATWVRDSANTICATAADTYSTGSGQIHASGVHYMTFLLMIKLCGVEVDKYAYSGKFTPNKAFMGNWAWCIYPQPANPKEVEPFIKN